jgi:hypothetical protein
MVVAGGEGDAFTAGIVLCTHRFSSERRFIAP